MCVSQTSPRTLTKPLTKRLSDIRKKFCKRATNSTGSTLARAVAQLFVVRNKACARTTFKTIGSNYAMLVTH